MCPTYQSPNTEKIGGKTGHDWSRLVMVTKILGHDQLRMVMVMVTRNYEKKKLVRLQFSKKSAKT